MNQNKSRSSKASEYEKDLLGKLDHFYALLINQAGQSFFERFLKRLVNRLYRVVTPLIASQEADDQCDILILYFLDRESNPGLDQFFKRLEDQFAEKTIRFHKLIAPHQQIRFRKILSPPLINAITTDCYYLAPYAAYIAKHYRPKLMVTFIEWNPMAVPLYLFAKREDTTVVNIAHAMTSNSIRCAINTFDYNFVLGSSAAENMKKNPNLLGDAKIIESGYFKIDNSYRIEPNPGGKILYFSDWMAKGLEKEIKANMQLVSKWARVFNHELIIKLHPLEDADIVRELFSGIETVEILPKQCTMQEALSLASMCILAWSSASLEASVAQRPIIIANLYPEMDHDYLDLEHHFGIAAKTAEEIEEKVQNILIDPKRYSALCENFSSRHLTYSYDAQDRIIQSLDNILHSDINLKENISD